MGASGAVFSLVGLAIAHGWRRGGAYGAQLQRGMLRWAIYILLFGFVMGADNFAHVGGLVAGGLLGLLLPAGRPGHDAPLWRAAAVAGISIVVWAFVMAGLHGGEALARFR